MKNIAVQLYSLRNLKQSFDETLTGVAAIGYNGVELIGTHNISADEMNALLHKHGLTACSAHVPMQMLDGDLADAGMSLHYHNHDFEMRVYDGKTAIDWLLESAKPENLKWEADVAWIARGGQDIVGMINKYSSRITRLHTKDNAPVGENVDQGGFADVGYGTVEWDLVLPAAKKAGIEWYIVEHDLPKDPMNTIKRGYEFLKKHL